MHRFTPAGRSVDGEAGAKAGRGAKDGEEGAPPEAIDEAGRGAKDGKGDRAAGRDRGSGVGDR